MRVLFVPNAYAPVHGGTELQCQRVAEIFARQGHCVRVLTSNISSVEGYYRFGLAPVKRPHHETMNGVNVVRVRYGNSLYQYLGCSTQRLTGRIGTKLASRLMRIIRAEFCKDICKEIASFAPDVVISSPHLVINVQAVLLAHRIQGFPLVLEPLLHEACPSWDQPAMTQALRQADAVLAVTQHELNRLIDAYQVSKDIVFLGGMGVDVPTSQPPKGPGIRILFLGRKVSSKGIPLLLQAMEIVWEKRPEVELVIAGARTPETTMIDQLFLSLSPKNRARILSLDDVSETHKHELLCNALCLVLPSKVESFGVVILEAWARALPVVALNLPVFRSIISSGDDGLLVSPDDPAALARALLQLVSHHDLGQIMGERGHQKVKSYYSWEQVAERFMVACHAAIENSSVGDRLHRR